MFFYCIYGIYGPKADHSGGSKSKFAPSSFSTPSLSTVSNSVSTVANSVFTPLILVATRARADVLILPLFSASAARSFFQQLGRHCACVPLALLLLLLLRQAPCFDEELCKKTGTIGRSVLVSRLLRAHVYVRTGGGRACSPNNRSYFIRCVLLWFEFMYASSIRIRVALSFRYLADPNGICWISHQEKWNGSLNKKTCSDTVMKKREMERNKFAFNQAGLPNTARVEGMPAYL